MINIGSGHEISIGDLAKSILELIGKDIPVICDSTRIRPDNSEVDRLCADNSKAQNSLGWEPQYTLKDGLAETIEWLEKNIDRYRLGTYTI